MRKSADLKPFAAHPPADDGPGFVYLNDRAEVRLGNAEFFRQCGTTAREIRGRRVQELIAPGLRREASRLLVELLRGDRDHFISQTVLARPDGGRLACTVTATVMHDEPGEGATVAVLVRPSGPVTEQPCLLDEVDARILEGIAGGLSSVSLAGALFLSRQTVDYHVARLVRKLRVPNRAALVARAYSAGLLSMTAWPPRVLDAAISR